MEKEFKREQINVMQKISKSLIDAKIELGQEQDDLARDLLTARLTKEIYANMAEKRNLIHYCDRPKFLDWLLRRRKKVIFKLVVKDLLLTPQPEGTERIYLTV